MKKIFVASILLLCAFMVSAQQGGGGFQQMSPEQRAQMQTQRYETLKKDLNLTDKQLDDIKKIETEYQTKQQSLREQFGQGGDREKMREEQTKLNNERNAKVKPLLSADQYTKYESQANQMGGPGGGGQRQGGGGNR